MGFKNINVNEKSQYISFMSPILKNKKGHTRQMTKSIKNIFKEDLGKILSDADELLGSYEKYSSNYESFLKAMEIFHKKAIEWVFDKTDIINKYNQNSIVRTIETKIPTRDNENNYIVPATLLIGASGSGKTTFIKQLIGAVDTDFPATMQSNTTIGSMIAVIQNEANQLTASAKLVNKSALRDRIEQAYIQIVKQVLRNERETANILYDNITIFDDKKVKLQYIILKDDINSTQLLSMIENESTEIWKDFLKISSDLPYSVSNDFCENSSVDFLSAFDEFVEEKIENSQIISELMEIVEKKVGNIVRRAFDFIKDKEKIEFSFEIIDENSIVQLNQYKPFSYPKMITMSINYQSNQHPDNNLRQMFFKALEYISSANENSQGNTLFPLIEHLRIRGNFKPLWYGENDLQDYIIIDSEGIGHDITNQSVSMQMREIMSRCNLISVIQNGAEQMQTAFAETLKSLIYNGWIDKTKFCFNRMESFDSKAHTSAESKLTFINSNIKNVLKQIVSLERNEEQKIVSSREDIFEKLILERSLYFEYLKEHLADSEKFLPLDKKEQWEKINDMEMDELMKAQICESFFVQLSETNIFNPVKNTAEYLSVIVRKKKKFTLEEIGFKNFSPKYRADVFSAILSCLNNTFVNKFIQRMYESPWQTVKAFNARIAGNWDNREWRPLQPEALFIELANTAIMQYLLNPENINEINERNGLEFTTIVQQIVSEVISSFSSEQSVNKIAERTIYSDLLEECWRQGIQQQGKGSTHRREILIEEKMRLKFYVDYEKGCRNFLYNEMVSLVMDNDFTKALSAIYR